jgi:hypothetical protein
MHTCLLTSSLSVMPRFDSVDICLQFLDPAIIAQFAIFSLAK